MISMYIVYYADYAIIKLNVQIFVCEYGITNNYFFSLQAFKNKNILLK